ncbi:MAG: methyltransferase domain-containing protein [Thermoflexia bacterium]|nr:MAG: methyltransferase domain-containing protein [Thermoflexia bacterium]
MDSDEERPERMNERPPICDYEGSRYRTEFWNPERAYEDGAERAALRALLPPIGRFLVDIGAGFGRLADLYGGYERVVLLDYARSQLLQARERLGEAGPGGRPCYLYVLGDFYRLPFAPGLFDAVVMVRTLHHAADAPAVLRQVSRILAPGGTFVLEFASKRHLKAVLRYFLRRQAWSPFDPEPVEFVPLNYDFHPRWVREHLRAVGLRVRRARAVSFFRVGFLKRAFPVKLLVALDRWLQPLGALYPLTPSVFLQAVAPPDRASALPGAFFRCTACGSLLLVDEGNGLRCIDCGAAFPVQDGLYDFRSPDGVRG